MPDNETAYETGTETLGAGGTISGGSASFAWTTGDSLKRSLGVSGIAAILSITENSTDTYGFGESGTETITTGGEDMPGTVGFAWNQMGTDAYNLNQSNSGTLTGGGIQVSTSYNRTLSDTTSSSWGDTGADFLGGEDVLTGETDAYTWNQLTSDSMSVIETGVTSSPSSSTSEQLSGVRGQFGQTSDNGYDSLTTTTVAPGDVLLYVASESDNFSISQAWADSPRVIYSSDDTAGDEGSATAIGSDAYDIAEVGWRNSGDTTQSSDSYALDDYYYLSTTGFEDNTGSIEADGTNQGLENYTLNADGTNSLSGSGVSQSTLDFDELYTATTTESLSWGASLLDFYGTWVPYMNENSDTAYNCWTETGNSTVGDGYSSAYEFQIDQDTATVADYGTDNGGGEGGGTWDQYVSSGMSPLTDTYLDNNISGETATWSGGSVGYTSTFDGNELGLEFATDPYASCCPSIADAPAGPPSNDVGGALSGPLDPGDFGIDVPGPPAYDALYATVSSDSERIVGFLLPSPEIGVTTSSQTATGVMGGATEGNDGVSRSAPPSPTSTLITLAAAGRNPTDITLPTAGTEAVDPPPGSHLEPGAVPYVEGELPMSLRPARWGPGAAQQAVASNSMVLRPGVNTVNYDPYGTLQQSRMAALEDSSGMGSAVAAGIIQGGANSINGAQDALVGTVNLIPLAINKIEGNHVPYIPSSDWARNKFSSESDWTHDKSKLVGGTGVLTAATAGLGAGAAGTGAAASQTGTIVVQAEARLAVAAAGTAVTPATAAAVGGLGVGAIGQTVQMSVRDPDGGEGITRSEHAKLRSTQGRPVGQAVNDVQRAGPRDVFVQPDDGRFVVRGPNGREHIIEPSGELVTSLNRPNSAHIGRLRDGAIVPATEEQFQTLKAFVQ